MDPDQQWQWQWTRTRLIGISLVAVAGLVTAFTWQPWYLTVPLVVGTLAPFLLFSYQFSLARMGGVALVAILGGLVVAVKVQPWYVGLPVLVALALLILVARLSWIERGIILAISLVLGALLTPVVTTDHTRRYRIRAAPQAQSPSRLTVPNPQPSPLLGPIGEPQRR